MLENVNSDEENRKFYAEVILDETFSSIPFSNSILVFLNCLIVFSNLSDIILMLFPKFYTSNKDFFSTLGQMNEMTSRFNANLGETIEKGEGFTIRKIKDSKNDITYILLSATLDNGYLLYIRVS